VRDSLRWEGDGGWAAVEPDPLELVKDVTESVRRGKQWIGVQVKKPSVMIDRSEQAHADTAFHTEPRRKRNFRPELIESPAQDDLRTGSNELFRESVQFFIR